MDQDGHACNKRPFAEVSLLLNGEIYWASDGEITWVRAYLCEEHLPQTDRRDFEAARSAKRKR